MMNWLNPHGSLWSTPTYGGRFFSSDSEAVYQTDRVGVHTAPPVERFPSTTEGIHKLLNVFKAFTSLHDAVEDDRDIYGVHEALGLHNDLRDVSVYDYADLLGYANEYKDDLREVIGLLYMDLLQSWHSQSGAKEAITMWSVVNNTTMEELLGQVSEGEILEGYDRHWTAA